MRERRRTPAPRRSLGRARQRDGLPRDQPQRPREAGQPRVRPPGSRGRPCTSSASTTTLCDATAALEPYRRHLAADRLDRVGAPLLPGVARLGRGGGDDARRRRRRRPTPRLAALRLLQAADALAGTYRLAVPRELPLRQALSWTASATPRRPEARRERAAPLPRTALDFFRAALDDYGQGRFNEAGDACDEVLREDAQHFWRCTCKRSAACAACRWAEAKSGLTACLGLRADFPWGRLLRATVNSELTLYRDAEADFAQVLAKAPDDAFRAAVLLSRGACRLRQKHLDEAVSDLNEAIRLQPEGFTAYATLARVQWERGDRVAAIAALDQALARPRGDETEVVLRTTRAAMHLSGAEGGPALFEFGAGVGGYAALVQLRRQHRQAAQDDFKNVIEREKNRKSERLASARTNLARLRHEAGDEESALSYLADALADRPEYAPAYRWQADILLAQGKYREAGTALDGFLTAGGKQDGEVYRIRGLIHSRLHEYPQALDAFHRSLILQPSPRTLTLRGWTYLAVEAPQPARLDFDAALRQNPADTEALCGRGQASAQLGQTEAALEDAEEALRRGPRTALLLVNVACIHGRLLLQPSLGESGRYARSGTRPGTAAQALQEKRTPEEQAAFWRDHIRGEPARRRCAAARGCWSWRSCTVGETECRRVAIPDRKARTRGKTGE